MLTAGFYLSFVFINGYENILSLAAKLGITGWLLILGCSLGNYIFRFVRWNLYLQKLHYIIPGDLHIHYYMAGFALTTTPGKAGETIRSLYLKSHGVNYSHSLAAFFTERFLDVIIITLLATLALLTFEEYSYFVAIVIVVLFVILYLLRSRFFISILSYISKKWANNKVVTLINHLINLLKASHDLLQSHTLYTGLLLGLVAWSIQGFAFFYILTTLDVNITLYGAMAIYAISLLAGALSFIPGGIGATEAVMGLLLIASGADTSTAITVPIISRVSTLWFAVTLGLLSTGYLSFRQIPIQPESA